MPYIYMDLMKQAIPGDYIKNDDINADPKLQFAVFGTYDWLHCEVQTKFPTTIWELKEKHEKRHSVCWNYERQPIFLYFCDKYADTVKNICNNKYNEYRAYPLVMTLLQVEKHSLCNQSINLETFLEAFQNKVDGVIKAAKINESDIKFCVCWNLSGSDILILSRTKSLKNVYEIIRVLQKDGICIEGEDEKKRVHVFSFSSHCAFPCKGQKESETAMTGHYVDRNAVVEWLENEEQGFSMISFVETSHNYDGIVFSGDPYQILFGERDYRLRLQKGNLEELADVIVNRLNDQEAGPGGVYSFRSSYLVPGIYVNGKKQSDKKSTEQSDQQSDENGTGRCTSQLLCDTLKEDNTYKTYSTLKARFDRIDGIVRSKENVFGKAMPDALHPISQQIFYCTNSLLGILKYSMRLQATINQYDLYCYITKLYEGFDHAVARYEEKIIEFSKNETQGRNPDYLRKFVSNLVVQSMSFVSELQHLFSVLALSPHNYMETYSSSMRSLNAASKLWGAYSGMIEKIASLFQVEIGGKTQKCTVMLSPYRERKSQNSMFLSAFAEEKTFVLLQMNFALMFRPQMAVFMIAHECGHHFADRCREMRFELMTKSYFSHLLEAAFRPYYLAPLHLLVSVEDKGEGGNEEKRNLYYKYLDLVRQDNKDKAAFRNLLEIHLLNELSKDTLVSLYQKWCEQLKAAYSKKFSKALDDLYRAFKEKYDAYKGKNDTSEEKNDTSEKKGDDKGVSWKYKFYFGEVLMDSYETVGPPFLDKAVDDISHKISACNQNFVDGLLKDKQYDNLHFDLNQMARLSAFWADRHADAHNKNNIVVNLNIRFDTVSKATVMLFREIYADIFAVLVLGMSLDDYKAIILAFLDTYEPLLKNPITVRRIYAVFDAVYGGGSRLKEWIYSDECLYSADVKRAALSELFNLESSFTKDYICNYARICSDKLRTKIKEIQASPAGNEALEKVRALSLYGDRGKFVDSLWYFWKGAMTS